MLFDAYTAVLVYILLLGLHVNCVNYYKQDIMDCLCKKKKMTGTMLLFYQ